ncbi:PREDICTED: dixin-like [Amphimedon queenslandica]|uniref:DIX domain-containing protein n=1 Tax=Amphimedon queenslandica TaxID=400682 RepID=A0A1X7VUH7_AMPQE|nr:PREDICTED: dixin-like [Amphimedon queenslandica]|eukprot:XP_019853697.1 PREDICTED: dixin-like [Amphimedon queenslandica]
MPTEKSESQAGPEEGGHTKKSRFPQFAKRKPKVDEVEKKKQVQDYIAWVNNYLRKRPRANLITDLRSGMQDGITLINLVEIAANSEIPFVDRNPLSASARRSNIEKAIAFLNSDGANLGTDSTKDIIDGSMKGVMRVILAIAEKYNPRSVRPVPKTGAPPQLVSGGGGGGGGPGYTQDHPHYVSPQTIHPTDIHHSPRATSPLTSTFMTGGGGGGVAGINTLPQQGGALSQSYNTPQPFHPSQPVALSQSQGLGPHPPTSSYSLSQPTQAPPDGIYSTPIDSLPQHVTQHITRFVPRNRVLVPRPNRTMTNTSIQNHKPPVLLPLPNDPPPPLPPPPIRNEENRENRDPKQSKTEPSEEVVLSAEFQNEIGGIVNQLSEFKTELLKLHGVLLDNINGGVSDADQEASELNVKLPLELANIQISEKDREIEELCEKLKNLEEQSKKVDSECDTLRNMVMERNQFITSMKSEIYRKEYRNDTERVDLQTQLHHKEKTAKVLEGEVSLLKASLEGKDREVTDMREKIRQHESIELELREELDRAKGELLRLASNEESLHIKLSSRDKRITTLEERLEEGGGGGGKRFDTSLITDETDSIRRKLEILKGSLDQQQLGLLDNLEKSISELYAKLNSTDSRSFSPSRRPRRYHEERREEKRRRHKASKEETAVYHTIANPSNDWTKVFYYMTGDKTETPYVTTVPRKSNEVRLKDFKAVFDRQGSYRFYFKTQDPDCGVVREEIVSEDQLLPDWNGKIMVWVSEKAHHR